LGFEVGVVDGFFGDARGGSGFEAAEFEAEFAEGVGEAAGGLFVDASAFGFFSPVCMRARRKVPVVTMTERAERVRPSSRRRPVMRREALRH
jgi:hypothetical protein